MKVKLHINNNLDPSEWEDQVKPQLETLDFLKGPDESEIHVFDDHTLKQHVNYPGKLKVAWIREIYDIYEYACLHQPEPYNPYEYVENNIEHFDYLIAPIDYKYFSHFVPRDRFFLCPGGNCRIKEDQWGLYEKDKMLSIVASSKDWTIGHRLRHMVINSFKDHIDVYGNGYNDIIDQQGNWGKVYALAPYHFHLVIMNSVKDSWYTEALIDAFATGCIPIFYGCSDIGKHFNSDGIIQFRSLHELSNIIQQLSPELYNSKLDAVQENMQIASKQKSDYDYLYNKYYNDFKKMVRKK